MKPIGEYPSVAEYKAAGVRPLSAQQIAERVATATAHIPRIEPERVDSVNGVENPAAGKHHVEESAKEAAVASISKDIETPADAANRITPIPDEEVLRVTAVEPVPFASAENNKYVSVLRSIPLPPSDKYDLPRLRAVIKFAIAHALETGNERSALTLLYLWSNAVDDEFQLSLIANVSNGERGDEQLRLALMAVLNNSYNDARQWYLNYTRTGSADPASGKETNQPTANSVDVEPSFKVSDIYRDTSGPRVEEQFLSGKSNTAPLKRPKKPVPVNENAHKRKRNWESDPKHETNMGKKRARLQQEFNDHCYSEENSTVRSDIGPPDAIQHPYTINNADPIDRPRSLPVSGSILDLPLVKGPEPAPESVCSGPSASLIGRKTGKPVSRRQHKPAQRARSLSIDTTLSDVSSLSNSVYSARFNNWTGPHPPRQMPNSMYVN
jgi:hypothetical protein